MAFELWRACATIPFTVVESNTRVKVSIFNTHGQHVATIHDQPLEKGFYEVTWDGTDGRGTNVAPGMYIYQLQAGNNDHTVTQSRKLICH